MKYDKQQYLLYAISNRHWLNGESLLQQVEAALKGGITMFQLREKNYHQDLDEEIIAIQQLCKHYQVPFIVNDDVMLAKKFNADGVHLGQDDGDIQKARDILGDDKLIGVSVHNLQEAMDAKKRGADYLGVGAVFQTSTKGDASPVSLNALKEICQSVDIPVVAIGGINVDNIMQLTGSLISGAAVISAIFASEDKEKATGLLKQKLQRIVYPQIHTALTIAGSDCSGGAGVQADLKTMAAHHVYGMSAFSALTAQNTKGVSAIMDVTPFFMQQQLEAIFDDIYPESVKIGMVSNQELIMVISEFLKSHHVYHIVIDPVMVATSGAKLLQDDAIETLKTHLFPLATLLTPNIPEGEILAGMTIKNEEDMKKAAQIMGERYQCAVLLKGGHRVEDANDLLYDQGVVTMFRGQRIDNENTHGTGCTLSSAIASHLAKGATLNDAITLSKRYISEALMQQLDLGDGHGPMDHLYALKES